ncbi:FAD-binding domain-containing protein [Thiomicrorhabdus indica]|uniref:FAD-binding domain-containing protein n=1 Tax=Thiomicrorhabdus indica TaxID=2267253 RepID=UPI002AA802F0|nr:FAD-binding domain-containing protein [Thiomicrorhabdus indica]
MFIVQLDNSTEPTPQALLQQPIQQSFACQGFLEVTQSGDDFSDSRHDKQTLPAGKELVSIEKRFATMALQLAPSRRSAIERLQALDVKAYANTRNHLDGAITKLSAFIENGLISEQEIIGFLQDRLGQSWSTAYRFVQQLSWREFFQQKWHRDYMSPMLSQQAYKTGWQEEDYQRQMPSFITQAETDSAFINQLIQELQSTGFLHNHGRLYLASYIVHWCQVHWKTGAQWMLQYLVDGNLASNHFSWQWVASTNSPKPYIFNLENAQRFCGERYDTSVASNPSLAASYEELHERLFPNLESNQK